MNHFSAEALSADLAAINPTMLSLSRESELDAISHPLLDNFNDSDNPGHAERGLGQPVAENPMLVFPTQYMTVNDGRVFGKPANHQVNYDYDSYGNMGNANFRSEFHQALETSHSKYGPQLYDGHVLGMFQPDWDTESTALSSFSGMELMSNTSHSTESFSLPADSESLSFASGHLLPRNMLDSGMPPLQPKMARVPVNNPDPPHLLPWAVRPRTSKKRPSSTKLKVPDDNPIRRRKARARKDHLWKAFQDLERIEETLRLHSAYRKPNQFNLKSPFDEIRKHIHHEIFESVSSTSSYLSRADDSGFMSSSSSFHAPSSSSSVSLPASYSRENNLSMASYTASYTDKNEDMAMDVDTPRANDSRRKTYHCTFKDGEERCGKSFSSKTDWKRHESSEKHWPQTRHMCVQCNMETQISVDDEHIQCGFCLKILSATHELKIHTLQCGLARQNGRSFVRLDHWRQHFRDEHPTETLSDDTDSKTYPIESPWPRQCGFCGVLFNTWVERVNHVAQHFERGLTITAWRLPFPRSKSSDHKPYTPRRDDGYDDEDDNDNFGDDGKGGGFRAAGNYQLPNGFSESDSSGPSLTSQQAADSQYRHPYLEHEISEQSCRPKWNDTPDQLPFKCKLTSCEFLPAFSRPWQLWKHFNEVHNRPQVRSISGCNYAQPLRNPCDLKNHIRLSHKRYLQEPAHVTIEQSDFSHKRSRGEIPEDFPDRTDTGVHFPRRKAVKLLERHLKINFRGKHIQDLSQSSCPSCWVKKQSCFAQNSCCSYKNEVTQESFFDTTPLKTVELLQNESPPWGKCFDIFPETQPVPGKDHGLRSESSYINTFRKQSTTPCTSPSLLSFSFEEFTSLLSCQINWTSILQMYEQLRVERLRQIHELEVVQQKKLAQRKDEGLKRIATEAMHKLQNLIRARYELDKLIWSLRLSTTSNPEYISFAFLFPHSSFRGNHNDFKSGPLATQQTPRSHHAYYKCASLLRLCKFRSRKRGMSLCRTHEPALWLTSSSFCIHEFANLSIETCPPEPPQYLPLKRHIPSFALQRYLSDYDELEHLRYLLGDLQILLEQSDWLLHFCEHDWGHNWEWTYCQCFPRSSYEFER